MDSGGDNSATITGDNDNGSHWIRRSTRRRRRFDDYGSNNGSSKRMRPSSSTSESNDEAVTDDKSLYYRPKATDPAWKQDCGILPSE